MGFVLNPKSKKCYYVSDVTATRDEAAKYCELFDSKLVQVDDEMENYFLKFNIKNKMGEFSEMKDLN